MRNTFVNTLLGFAQRDDKIFVVSGDAGFGVFDEFQRIKPDRFRNVGVAEANMIGFAAGLSLEGFKVYVYNIIPFLLFRCYEQVRNDICYQELPVTLVGIGSGITYAPQGVTHYSVEDIALARTLPNLQVLSPIDPVEAEKCAIYSYHANKPVYVRLAKSGEVRIQSSDVDITKPCVINDGEDIAIVFHGSISEEVIKARDILYKIGIYPKIISVTMIQPFNADYFFDLIGPIKKVVSVEEHFVCGGLGSILSEAITDRGLDVRLYRLGIRMEFIHVVKQRDAMRKHYGIDGDGIAETVKKIISSGG